VARGTQHIRKRPRADAARVAKRGRRKANTQESQLFFERLRGGAKWVFVFLALVFGLGFVLFGVGSGSSGIGDVLRNQFNFGGGGSTSVGELQKKTREHPSDATAWRDLGSRLATDGRTDESIAAWERYAALRPKDDTGLRQLAGLLTTRARDLQTEAQLASYQAQAVAGTPFQPAATSPFGRAFNDPAGLQDPVSQAVVNLANQKASEAYSKLSGVQTKAVATYRKLIVLDPADPTLQIQLADASLNSGDQKTAIAAYKKFLKLAPDDPLAPAVKKQLKQLTAAASQSTSTG
jgi:tetratricopeptide (TPR) repeat protein